MKKNIRIYDIMIIKKRNKHARDCCISFTKQLQLVKNLDISATPRIRYNCANLVTGFVLYIFQKFINFWYLRQLCKLQ